MLYIVYGSDRNKTTDKTIGLIESLKNRKPDASYFKITSDNLENFSLEELSGGQGLFEQKYIVFLFRILESGINFEYFEKYLEAMTESDNIFIWLEEDFDKKDLEKIKKVSKNITEYSATEEARDFSLFNLCDAIGEKDKKKAWRLYIEAVENTASEEIYSMIMWQLKSMKIASSTKSVEESGMKPFPYNKAKRFAKNFSEKELNQKIMNLLEVYYRARKGEMELQNGIEKFVLGI